MDFLHQVKLSLTFYVRSVRFIDQHSLWHLLIIPAVINLIIAGVMVIVAIRSSGILVDFVITHLAATGSESQMYSLIEGALMVIIRAFVFFLYLKVYRYVLLILLSPVFAVISAKVQLLDSSKQNTMCTSKYLQFCSRGIRIAIRNFFVEIILSTVVVIISLLISWVIPVVPIVILLLESYFMGYSMADYRNEYHSLDSRSSRKLINHYSGLVIGNGLFFNLILLIPVVGVLLAPVLALVASGLSINYVEKRKQILCNSDQSTLIMAR